MEQSPFVSKESEVYCFEVSVFVSDCCGPDSMILDEIRIVTSSDMISAHIAPTVQ